MRPTMTAVVVACAVVWACPAHATAGQAASFVGGIGHPVGGLDHILVMLAVGVWGVLAGGRALWVWPAVFVSTMVTGFVAATLRLQLPCVAGAISSSVIVLGLLVTLAVKAPVWVGAVVVGLFAFFHGHAHGTEAAEVSRIAYGAGFALATAGLHVSGIGLGFAAQGSIGNGAMRAMGTLTVFGGLALLGG